MGLGLATQVAGALSGSASAGPSVRKPVFEIQFGAASKDEWAAALAGFSIEAGAAPFVDTARVEAASAQGPSGAPGDSGSIKTGYGDSSTDLIFSGQIEAVRYGIEGLTRFSASTGAAS